MEESLAFGSREYLVLLAALAFGRAMDFISTWTATPNLVLEANPIARWLGWKWGIPVNIALVLWLASEPVPAIVVTTTSLLVAAHNFQHAWVMRSAGEWNYRLWMRERMAETSPVVFAGCLLGQTLLTALVGAAVIWAGGDNGLTFGIGAGIVGYALAVLLFTVISLWRGGRFTR
jgi:hypothetical protein